MKHVFGRYIYLGALILPNDMVFFINYTINSTSEYIYIYATVAVKFWTNMFILQTILFYLQFVLTDPYTEVFEVCTLY